MNSEILYQDFNGTPGVFNYNDPQYHPDPAVRIAWMNQQIEQLSEEDYWDGDDSWCE